MKVEQEKERYGESHSAGTNYKKIMTDFKAVKWFSVYLA